MTEWDTTEGFFSRWIVVPFSRFFPAGRADVRLIDRLTTHAELQGLLRASVSGLQAVMRRGSFGIPASVANATERFKREADPMRGFIDERVERKPQEFLSRTDFYNAYTTWAELNGFHQMSAQRFYESFVAACTSAGYPLRTVTLHGIRGYKDIALSS